MLSIVNLLLFPKTLAKKDVKLVAHSANTVAKQGEKSIANEVSQSSAATEKEDEKLLPIEDSPLPTDISDLRDVVDAINKLCDTMKTSCDEETFEDCAEPLLNEEIIPEEVLAEIVPDPDWYVTSQIEASPDEVIFKKVEHYNTETWRQSVSRLELTNVEEVPKVETMESIGHHNTETEALRQSVSRLETTNPEEVITKVETTESIEHYNTVNWRQSVSRLETTNSEEVTTKVETTERWSDSTVSLGPEMSDEPVQAPGEISEMYYTASSEVSLLSDLECPDKGLEEGERRECVVAGHVAAMRERFENMTRANTPCPDARDITPSPDHLG